MAPTSDARWLTPFSDEKGEGAWQYLDRVSGNREIQGIGQDLGHEQVLTTFMSYGKSACR
jgi:hypothetical protein